MTYVLLLHMQSRQLNTERARQGQKAREQLRDRWQQLQQRRAAVGD